jgi:hypothetical protein
MPAVQFGGRGSRPEHLGRKKILTARSILVARRIGRDGNFQELKSTFVSGCFGTHQYHDGRKTVQISDRSTMTNTSHDKAFRSSLDMLGEDKRVRNVIELGEMFAKAIAYENGAAERENAQLMARCRGSQLGARFDRDLGEIAKSFPAPKAEPRPRVEAAPTESDLLIKAESLLRFGEGLNAAQRGELMLGISARSFAKAERHPVALHVDAIRAQLEKARAERDLGPATPFIEEALAHIARGVTDSDERGRLMSLLQQARDALAAGDTAALGVGDAR